MEDELLKQKKEIQAGIRAILDKYRTKERSTNVEIKEFLQTEYFRISKLAFADISDNDKKIRTDFNALKELEASLRQVYSAITPRPTILTYGTDVEFNNIVYGWGLIENNDDPIQQAFELGIELGAKPKAERLPSQAHQNKLPQEAERRNYHKKLFDALQDAGLKFSVKPLPNSHTWQYIVKRIIDLVNKENYLTDKQKEVFKLRFFNLTTPFDSIGKQLNMTKQTAQEHFKLAVEKLKTDKELARYFKSNQGYRNYGLPIVIFIAIILGLLLQPKGLKQKGIHYFPKPAYINLKTEEKEKKALILPKNKKEDEQGKDKEDKEKKNSTFLHLLKTKDLDIQKVEK
jgi:hypothetical protein